MIFVMPSLESIQNAKAFLWLDLVSFFQRRKLGFLTTFLVGTQVCEEARCPNIGECWGGGKGTATATIMVDDTRRTYLFAGTTTQGIT